MVRASPKWDVWWRRCRAARNRPGSSHPGDDEIADRRDVVEVELGQGGGFLWRVGRDGRVAGDGDDVGVVGAQQGRIRRRAVDFGLLVRVGLDAPDQPAGGWAPVRRPPPRRQGPIRAAGPTGRQG